jgi:predicted lipid-binding transport protein (Tim44 family)
LIFIQSFAACADKARALGSNLIGALIGGLLESLSFVTGVRALVILVGLFYLIAILRRPASVR